MFAPPPRPVFAPMAWILPQPGTNGYISTWGAMLSGTVPVLAAA